MVDFFLGSLFLLFLFFFYDLSSSFLSSFSVEQAPSFPKSEGILNIFFVSLTFLMLFGLLFLMFFNCPFSVNYSSIAQAFGSGFFSSLQHFLSVFRRFFQTSEVDLKRFPLLFSFSVFLRGTYFCSVLSFAFLQFSSSKFEKPCFPKISTRNLLGVTISLSVLAFIYSSRIAYSTV